MSVPIPATTEPSPVLPSSEDVQAAFLRGEEAARAAEDTLDVLNGATEATPQVRSAYNHLSDHLVVLAEALGALAFHQVVFPEHEIDIARHQALADQDAILRGARGVAKHGILALG